MLWQYQARVPSQRFCITFHAETLSEWIQLISYFRTISWIIEKSIFTQNDEHKSKEKHRSGWRQKKKSWHCNFYQNLNRVPQVSNCLTAWVPTSSSSAHISKSLSPQVSRCPECQRAQVPFEFSNTKSAQVPQYLQSPRIVGVLFECPSSALWVPECPLSALRVNEFQKIFLTLSHCFRKLKYDKLQSSLHSETVVIVVQLSCTTLLTQL